MFAAGLPTLSSFDHLAIHVVMNNHAPTRKLLLACANLPLSRTIGLANEPCDGRPARVLSRHEEAPPPMSGHSLIVADRTHLSSLFFVTNSATGPDDGIEGEFEEDWDDDLDEDPDDDLDDEEIEEWSDEEQEDSK